MSQGWLRPWVAAWFVCIAEHKQYDELIERPTWIVINLLFGDSWESLRWEVKDDTFYITWIKAETHFTSFHDRGDRRRPGALRSLDDSQRQHSINLCIKELLDGRRNCLRFITTDIDDVCCKSCTPQALRLKKQKTANESIAASLLVCRQMVMADVFNRTKWNCK